MNYRGPMTAQPVNLTAALASFDDIYSPRIVGRVNDYDVRIAHAKGEHVWHVHDQTDEFFLVEVEEMQETITKGVEVEALRHEVDEVPVGADVVQDEDRGDGLVLQPVEGAVQVGGVVLEPVAHHERLPLGEERCHRRPVRARHDDHGIFRGQVADRVGTTQSAIARLESGAGKPSVATLQRYAGALGYRVEIKLVKARSLTSRSTPTPSALARRRRG